MQLNEKINIQQLLYFAFGRFSKVLKAAACDSTTYEKKNNSAVVSRICLLLCPSTISIKIQKDISQDSKSNIPLHF